MLHLIELKTDNFQRIKAVLLKLTGSVVVGGRNGEGKSSLIRSLKSLLEGAGASGPQPVREGAECSDVTGTLSDGSTIRKVIKPNGKETLEIRNPEGHKIDRSPQGFLNRLTGGEGTFDVSRFALGTDEQRLKILQSLPALKGFDFDVYKDTRQRLYTDRTDANRDVKRLKAQLEGMPEWDVPTEAVSVETLHEELREARKANARHEGLRRDVEGQTEEWKGAQQELDRLTLERNILDGAMRKARAEVEQGANRVACTRGLYNTAKVIPEAPIFEQMKDADSTNQKIRENADRQAKLREMSDAGHEAGVLSIEIDKLDATKAAAMAAASLPAGLTIEDEAVLLKGLPFDVAGEAEKHMIAAEVGIAKIPKDGLGLLLMTGGGILDEDNLQLLQDKVGEKKVHMLIEVPRRDGVSVVIEEGEIRSAEPIQEG